MNFATQASKLLTNKYFLYFIIFVAITNLLGYVVNKKHTAIILFALIGLLSYQFSKNIAVILIISILVTNFMIVNRAIHEGFDMKTDDDDTEIDTETDTDNLEKAGSANHMIEKGVNALHIGKNVKNAKKILDNKQQSVYLDKQKVMDVNNSDLNQNKDVNFPEGVGNKIINNKKTKMDEHFGPRLDYAATIEQSYQHLDGLLGSDSIKQLTTDTQQLMQQQQTLFNTMNQMVPVLEGAQNMLKNFNINDLTGSLKGISSIIHTPSIGNKTSKA